MGEEKRKKKKETCITSSRSDGGSVKNRVRKISPRKFSPTNFPPGVFGMLDRRDVSISLFLIRLKRFVEVGLGILTPHVAPFSLCHAAVCFHGETNFVLRNNST